MTDDRTMQREDSHAEIPGGADEPVSSDFDCEIASSSANEAASADVSTSAGEEAMAATSNGEDLKHLVQQVANDPGAPFTPEALASLAQLKKEDRAGFEVLRSRLKAAGCRVTSLDEAMEDETGGFSEGAIKQADMLVALAQEAELFHSADRTAYADLIINDHRETWSTRCAKVCLRLDDA